MEQVWQFIKRHWLLNCCYKRDKAIAHQAVILGI
ncbi:hypothetical protein I6M90_15235 [Acinetobacter bereziniae]|nr:hypothetical protein [Acinetobacter bereziniae]MBJ8457410.1 hypothetical protein [Acinetobacter bereziniae]MCU4417703.1 hypothetical protein [Acinetobacter bereziniae]